MTPGLRLPLLACSILAIAGCGMQVDSTFEAVSRTPGATGSDEASAPASIPLSFDVAPVASNITIGCTDPDLVEYLYFDAEFCEQVKVEEMTASARLLTVPTTLHAGAFDRAAAICQQVAVAHLDLQTGVPLGYVFIEVLDQSGDYLADCRITSP